MKNRFLEWDSKNLPNAVKRTQNGAVVAPQSLNTGRQRAIFPYRSRSLSVQPAALVVLIENGGVDLGIPELVDKLLSFLPGSSLLPDSLRENLINAIRAKIKTVTDNLLESAELALGRYKDATPAFFKDVIVLRNSAATPVDLKNTLIRLSKENTLIDLMILTHGSSGSIVANGTINVETIRQMKAENGGPLKIRSVYMMNCVGSSLNAAWMEAGAKTSCGTKKNNYLPEPTTYFFWSDWKAGQPFETAAISAYKKTIALMNGLVNSILSSVLPFGMGFSVDFADFEFVQDSAPLISGEGSLTIRSNDLSFSQSAFFTQMTTTVLPVRRIYSSQQSRSMQAAGPLRLTASRQCIDLIKKMEGFNERKFNDTAGNCAVGYGTILHKGACNNIDATEIPYSNGITEAQATELLVAKIEAAQNIVCELVKTEINQNQFDALVSFVQHITGEAFANSTLLKMLNAGNFSGIADELKKWVKGKVGSEVVVVPQYVKRREEEARLFLAPLSLAQSMSRSGYSRPFYDTGEHSLIGQYLEQLKNSPIANMPQLSPTTFYSVNGVPFTYGQIITMGDFYENYTQMARASVAELQGLKNLIIRSENAYRSSIFKMSIGNAVKPEDSEWQTATNERYLELAAVNNSHFAPPPPQSAYKSSTKPNNKSVWEYYHGEAVKYVWKGTTDDDLNEALKINAFGDHFLTDAFSAGHLVNKELMIEKFKIQMLSGKSVDDTGRALLLEIAKGAFNGDVAAAFSKYQTSETSWGVNGYLDDADMFHRLLVGIMEQEPDKIANLFVKAIHDALNSYNNGAGVPVINALGHPWNLSGDGTLNEANLLHVQEAVRQSVQNIIDAVRQTSTPVAVFTKKVWDYVPLTTHPATVSVIDAVVKDYLNFKNGKLRDKAIKLIKEGYKELITALEKAKAIEPRQDGAWHPLNEIGNWVNDR